MQDPMAMMITMMVDQYDAMTDEEWRELASHMPSDLRQRYVESVGRVLSLMASVDLEGGVPDGG
jgi:hypothetical protein